MCWMDKGETVNNKGQKVFSILTFWHKCLKFVTFTVKNVKLVGEWRSFSSVPFSEPASWRRLLVLVLGWHWTAYTARFCHSIQALMTFFAVEAPLNVKSSIKSTFSLLRRCFYIGRPLWNFCLFCNFFGDGESLGRVGESLSMGCDQIIASDQTLISGEPLIQLLCLSDCPSLNLHLSFFFRSAPVINTMITYLSDYRQLPNPLDLFHVDFLSNARFLQFGTVGVLRHFQHWYDSWIYRSALLFWSTVSFYNMSRSPVLSCEISWSLDISAIMFHCCTETDLFKSTCILVNVILDPTLVFCFSFVYTRWVKNALVLRVFTCVVKYMALQHVIMLLVSGLVSFAAKFGKNLKMRPKPSV